MTDQLLKAYQGVAFSVARYIDSHGSEFETYPVELIIQNLEELGTMYGIDVPAYIKTLQENNDLAGAADNLRGDDLALIRITGTISQNLADLASCVYDVEASLQVAEVLGQFLGAILIIKEYEDA